ncbi:excinuclease ABC subunit A [Candidatus Shapirobacteria bacterium CG08_land_8_20_14_0_20_39_18]|uniref:UvrABC system protein A n=1 Tax=Candidatus Shapirobacteria bacterium CG08_land_8_20_14_0_20_39_18 TaxID=1974883 RepID=A0A2M6XD71_9BACT|nr:MAG: excinuclease ABC subunit A [Candidatus Shapirobacteria bacterium CG08_land_8_20_14_0_20_39_18]PIY66159.1 MAG: excinuclease ABC subunit A [Candidatus Shapirobacteria bacterium CG_4_10_14_0_8_um_filter_39_15]PJE68861.1 MAG: excinuclease ABC subunit A [Candidatus Shapirobacteria bacterium CG10_big_fil_rev_8_21_14_0_10_38_8]
MNDFIKIRGAREHNLKNIDVNIPKNKFVVFTGVSGSGKSSLAMDTLYAEGQRRYVESLSSYARQFLGMLPHPDVDSIEGLSPAIAIDQHGLSHNPRSTVGTVTEIYDYFRVLFARIGHPHCPNCGREIARQTSEQISRQIIGLAQEELKKREIKYPRFMILSPVVRDKRGEYSKLLDNLKHKGFEKVRIDGRFFFLYEDLTLIKTNRHNIDVVIDQFAFEKKLTGNTAFGQRVKDDVEIAKELSDGLVISTQILDSSFAIPDYPQKTKDTVFSSRFACPICNISLPEIEPRIFSFNSPFGACPECNGLGVKLRVDPRKVSQWRLSELENRYYTTTSDEIREEIEKLMIKETCQVCNGQRLKKESLNVTIKNQNIAQISSWSLEKLRDWVADLESVLISTKDKEIAQPILYQISSRISFLISVGVNYLTLDRAAATLSAGEGQRIRLASQLGSGLTGVLYVLDEPTVGLHPRDTHKLIDTLKKLRDLGNTLVVVEHDPKIIESADWVMDFGPEGGKKGGHLIAEGTPAEIEKNPNSITGKYLSGEETIPLLNFKYPFDIGWIKIEGCSAHNLKNINVKFPLGQLTTITGVSGSGKSSLMTDTLYPALKKAVEPDSRETPGKFTKLSGNENISQVYLVDQSPIGRTSRSNPATYTGVFTEIRAIFAQTTEARLKGLTETHFSFNTEGGRCEACQGQGQIRVEMQFLPDVWVECEECHGKRFKTEVLEVQYKEKNIAEILKLTISEALIFFGAIPAISRKLDVLKQIGLNYLELGQSSPTLSGGESQRLKLARELVKKGEGKSVYLLDEPTTGLHYADLKNLLYVLRALVDRGDTVILIEHNLEIIKQSDWLIDLGPEGGDAGGYVVGEGTVGQIKNNKKSWTGKYL